MSARNHKLEEPCRADRHEEIYGSESYTTLNGSSDPLALRFQRGSSGMKLLGQNSNCILALLGLVAILAGSVTLMGCDSSNTGFHRVTNLRLDYYLQPAAPQFAPADPTCSHNNAPLNLTVSTSWGASQRLERRSVDLYWTRLERVTTRTQHWLRIWDIRLCDWSGKAPLVTDGVFVDGVELTQLIYLEDGGVAFSFYLDGEGRVIP